MCNCICTIVLYLYIYIYNKRCIHIYIPLKWLTNYLSDRSQIVLYNDVYSDIATINCGVPKELFLDLFYF